MRAQVPELSLVRRRSILKLAGLACVGAGVILLLPDETPSGRGAATATAASEHGAPAAEVGLATLPQREGLRSRQGDIFETNVAPSARVAAESSARHASNAPATTAASAVPYRFAGHVVREEIPQVVLARNDRVVIARKGEILEDGYRVESIAPDGVTLVNHSRGKRMVLSLSHSAPRPPATAPPSSEQGADENDERAGSSHAARLHWEGPQRVQAGNTFDVVLKITSNQTVRNSPMQLSFDSRMLELVAVRAGDFVADGSFTYRANPRGSIFVGALGKGAVAADAEVLVVTFKPIRSGGVAELTISSMVLEGNEGSTVVHEPVAAFRTSITE
jgi:hypothetical protein